MERDTRELNKKAFIKGTPEYEKRQEILEKAEARKKETAKLEQETDKAAHSGSDLRDRIQEMVKDREAE